MASMPLNAGSFKETIENSKIPVIVDFYADWCQPCKQVAPLLEEIAAENQGKVLVCKVNVDENQQLAGEYSVMSIPFIISFKNGQVYKHVIGAVPKHELLALIN